MRYVIYSNIVWDTDGMATDLPATVRRQISEDLTIEDIDEDSYDYLSDMYGYCMFSFTYEIVEAQK